VFFDCRLPLAFDLTHLLGMIVVVRERPVDISHVEIVTISDRPRGQSSFFDLFFDELNGDPPALEMWLVVEFLHDTPFHLAHTEHYAATVLERLGPFGLGFMFAEPASRNSPDSVPGVHL
jgi:hypothetical protein